MAECCNCDDRIFLCRQVFRQHQSHMMTCAGVGACTSVAMVAFGCKAPCQRWGFLLGGSMVAISSVVAGFSVLADELAIRARVMKRDESMSIVNIGLPFFRIAVDHPCVEHRRVGLHGDLKCDMSGPATYLTPVHPDEQDLVDFLRQNPRPA